MENLGEIIKELQLRLDIMEKQVRWHSNLLHEVAIESVHSSRILESLHEFLVKNNLPTKIDPSISPDDRMFQYLLYVMSSYKDAIAEYFASGAQVFGVIEALSEARFGSLSNVGSFLDFAAGHGRLERYIVRRMDKSKVWVADIKPGAVEFQARQFGVNGLISTAQPENFQTDERFDIIFVASLFSHLPSEAFHGWLRKLWSLLSERGILAFSVHDAYVYPDGRVEEHKFSTVNEELFLDRVVNISSSDGVLDTNQYGMTWVTEKYAASAIHEACNGATYVRYPRGLGSKLQNQDLYLISPTGVQDLNGLNFPHYLMVEQYEKLGWAGSWLNAVKPFQNP